MSKEKQTIKVNNQEFHFVETQEPHMSRRREILAKYPQMVELFGPEPKTAFIILFIVFAQVLVASYLRDKSWGLIFVVAYVFGGTVNHSIQLACHELSHSLGFGVAWMDKLMGCIANCPTGIPSMITFIKYHMDHHRWQGTLYIDTDVPTEWECKTFKGPFMKFLWCVLTPFFYSLRPVYLNPKKPHIWELLNFIIVAVFDYMIYTHLGFKSLAYLLMGTFLGLGFHPLAGHFIAEHYEFTRGQETYSYYGYLNWLMFNVGYHNEHHDFPRVPWSKLKEVRKIAPEYYDNLVCYDSYFPIFYEYIFNPKLGPWSRVTRAKEGKKKN